MPGPPRLQSAHNMRHIPCFCVLSSPHLSGDGAYAQVTRMPSTTITQPADSSQLCYIHTHVCHPTAVHPWLTLSTDGLCFCVPPVTGVMIGSTGLLATKSGRRPAVIAAGMKTGAWIGKRIRPLSAGCKSLHYGIPLLKASSGPQQQHWQGSLNSVWMCVTPGRRTAGAVPHCFKQTDSVTVHEAFGRCMWLAGMASFLNA